MLGSGAGGKGWGQGPVGKVWVRGRREGLGWGMRRAWPVAALTLTLTLTLTPTLTLTLTLALALTLTLHPTSYTLTLAPPPR